MNIIITIATSQGFPAEFIEKTREITIGTYTVVNFPLENIALMKYLNVTNVSEGYTKCRTMLDASYMRSL